MDALSLEKIERRKLNMAINDGTLSAADIAAVTNGGFGGFGGDSGW